MDDSYLVTSFAWPASSKLPNQICSDPNASTVVIASPHAIAIVSLLDNSNLATLELGPSVKTNTATLASTTFVDADHIRKRWIAIALQDKHEVWSWSDEVHKDGTYKPAEPKKTVTKTGALVVGICTINASQIAFLQSDGLLSFASLDFEITASVQLDTTDIASCMMTPIPSRLASSSTIAVVTHAVAASTTSTGTTQKKKARKSGIPSDPLKSSLHCVSVDQESASVIKHVPLTEEVSDVCFSPCGYLQLLATSGQWSTLAFSDALELRLVKSVQLASSIALTKPSETGGVHAHVFPLDDAFVALATSQKASPENVTLSLWDTNYGVCLSTSSIKLASQHSTISLSRARGPILVCHTNAKDTRIYGIPITCPSKSKTSHVVGKGQYTTRLGILEPVTREEERAMQEAKRKALQYPKMNPHKQKLVDEAAASRYELVDAMEALASSSKAEDHAQLDPVFTRWCDKRVEALIQYRQAKDEVRNKATLSVTGATGPAATKQKALPEGEANDGALEQDDGDKTMVIGEQTEQGESTRRTRRKMNKNVASQAASVQPVMPGSFVQDLLRIATRPNLLSRPVKMIRYLLQRRLVSDHYIQGGLVRHLSDLNLWPLVQVALFNVSDVPEADLVHLLKKAIDGGGDGPSLPHVMARVLPYPAMKRPLRRALADQLSITDVAALLSVIADWMPYFNEQGSSDVKPPALKSVVTFMAVLLDAHFISILQDSATHAAIQEIYSQLQLCIAMTEQMVALSGPIKNVERESVVAKQPKNQVVDIGTYSLETFTI